MSRSFNYKAVDGRVYRAERIEKPQPTRKKVIFHGQCNEKMAAVDIYRIEKWLSGNLVDPLQNRLRVKPSEADKLRLKEEYALVTDPATNKTVGNERYVFEILCEKHPTAEEFGSYKKLLYCMRYGNAPCTVSFVGDGKSEVSR